MNTLCLNAGKRKQDAEHAESLRLMKNHEDYDEELGRVLTDEELRAKETKDANVGTDDDAPTLIE